MNITKIDNEWGLSLGAGQCLIDDVNFPQLGAAQ